MVGAMTFPLNPFYHEPGWNLKHKLHSVLMDLIDAVFWPVLALPSSTIYKKSCEETKTGSRSLMSDFETEHEESRPPTSPPCIEHSAAITA